MSSYADHQRMVTLEQRVATLEIRAAEAERVVAEMEQRVLSYLQTPLPAQEVLSNEAPSPYEQWREKKAARKAAD